MLTLQKGKLDDYHNRCRKFAKTGLGAGGALLNEKLGIGQGGSEQALRDNRYK